MGDEYQFECWTRGVGGAEGPLTTEAGEVFLVSPGNGQVLQLADDGDCTELANTGGKPAGLQLHADGSIWVADMERGILRVTREGAVEPVVTEYEGAPIRGCNDLAFDSAGNLYFTAPAGSSGRPGGAVGEVFSRTASGRVRRLADHFAFPNGIAVSPDDKRVLFAETFTHKLWAAEVNEPGEVGEWRVWATLPHTPEETAGGDGMDFDADGHLIATNYSRGSLEIYSPDGSHVRSIPLPFKKCSNVHFFPPPDVRLLVTEHENNALWAFPYGQPGHQQFGWTKSRNRTPCFKQKML